MRFLLAAFVLTACAATPIAGAEEEALSAAPVIAAERAFAVDASRRGWAAAFRSAAAPDGMTLSPDPVNAHENLAGFAGDGETTLEWRPAYAGIARSGDLGFTTGPYMFRDRDGIVGHYFTVWRLQPDGSWKWIFDAGTGVRDPGPVVAADAVVPTLSMAARGVGSAEAAIAAIRALERRIAIARPEPRSQLLRLLADDVRLNRAGRPAAIGRDAAEETALSTSLDASEEPIRIEASSAGDRVFVLGLSHWSEGGERREGYSARIWQFQAEGWRIVFDEIVPRPGPPTD